MQEMNLTHDELSDALHKLQRENELLKSLYDKDIAKYKSVEEKLTNQEAILEKAEEIAKFGNWQLLLSDGKIVSSKGAARIYGVLHNELTLENAQRATLPEYRPLLDKSLKELVQFGKPYNVEFKIVRENDGAIIDIHSVAQYDSLNSIVFGTIHDITDQKLVEKELNRSHLELKRAQEITHIGSFTIDLTTNQVTWTEELYKMYGFDPTLPVPLLDDSQKLFTPESWELLSSSIANAATTGVPYEIELKTTRKDGSHGWMWARGEAISDHSGKITEIWGAVQDITARKQDELLLKESEERLFAAQEIAQVGSWEYNIENNSFWGSEVGKRIYGFDSQSDQFTAEEVMKCVIDRERVDQALVDLITHDKEYNIEFEILPLHTDQRRTIHSTAKLIRDKEGTPVKVTGVLHDITNQKKIELELVKAKERAERSEIKLMQLNATKDKFFSIIAHDLKSPFNGILGLSDILKEEVRELDMDTIVAYADLINSSTKQTYRLLENLLEWARMQQGGVQFEPKRTFVNGVIDDEIEGLKNIAAQKSIVIVNETNEEVMITADEKMLGAVIRNLISNAIKFTPKEGKVKVVAKMVPDHVEVSISDTGVGMDKETIEKLFNIENNYNTRGTENEKGTGLGLLLCKEFVEKHEGNIRVESTEGKGSKFIFTIPVKN